MEYGDCGGSDLYDTGGKFEAAKPGPVLVPKPAPQPDAAAAPSSAPATEPAPDPAAGSSSFPWALAVFGTLVVGCIWAASLEGDQ